MNKVTIKDLAKMLNISTSTVSRALSNHEDISQATKDKVTLLAQELNYTSNLQAKLFRKQNSGLIALVLPEVNMFFSPQLIEGINKTIADSNYTLITFLSNDKLVTEKEIIKKCIAWAVEGVLISLSAESTNINHLDILQQVNIKCLLLDKTIAGNKEILTIGIDGASASYDATKLLLENGHTHILGIFGNPNLRITQNRISGYKKALAEYNIVPLAENIVSVEKVSELDYILPHILNHNSQITAIFTMSDELLATTHYHLGAAGKKTAEHISLAAISDGNYPYLLHPRVSHIRHSGYKLGKRAAAKLMSIIENGSNQENQLLSTRVIELESIKNLNLTKN